jgi:hypothetical protein
MVRRGLHHDLNWNLRCHIKLTYQLSSTSFPQNEHQEGSRPWICKEITIRYAPRFGNRSTASCWFVISIQRNCPDGLQEASRSFTGAKTTAVRNGSCFANLASGIRIIRSPLIIPVETIDLGSWIPDYCGVAAFRRLDFNEVTIRGPSRGCSARAREVRRSTFVSTLKSDGWGYLPPQTSIHQNFVIGVPGGLQVTRANVSAQKWIVDYRSWRQ